MHNRKLSCAMLEMLQLVAAGALFFTPWILGFTDVTSAAWSAWITAGAVALFASLISVDQISVAGWSTLGLGLWAMLAPGLLGFVGDVGATTSHVIAGMMVTICAIAVLWIIPHADEEQRGPANTQAG